MAYQWYFCSRRLLHVHGWMATAMLQAKPTGKYKLLDNDGLANVGQSIEDGDYFINKISPTNTKDPVPMAGNSYVLPDHMYKPSPMSYKGAKGESSIVDKVMITQNDENEQIFKVQIPASASALFEIKLLFDCEDAHKMHVLVWYACLVRSCPHASMPLQDAVVLVGSSHF